MDRINFWQEACAALLLCATPIGLPAQILTTLVSFNGTNGDFPGNGALVQGTDGNFYGTTLGSGNGSKGAAGTVFKITPGGELTTLYNFCSKSGCTDGATPYAGLIQASDGNLYGTTFQGGANDSGTVFRITSGGALTTLYSFCSQPGPLGPPFGCADGVSPSVGLIQASDGNLYGTTPSGGATNPIGLGGPNGIGTVFRITLGGTLTTLYSFCSQPQCADGGQPTAGLIQATDGNLYGTTESTAFKLSLEGALTTLYTFCSVDCPLPSGLIQATDGNFYGTTVGGGTSDDGTVFKMTPAGALTTLYSFCSRPGCTDGEGPLTGLIQASDGNFYGTTPLGGGSGVGTVFKITPGGTLTTLYTFSDGSDGASPIAGLLQATDGNFYGTTMGGSFGDATYGGTVFKLTPASSAPAINQSDGILNGASFEAGIVAGSLITIFGIDLSLITDSWSNAIVNGNLPTSLDGVKVSVGGEAAYISYISPTQINALAPNVGTGLVPVTVTNSSGTSSAVTVTVEAVGPAFFRWGNYAVATTQDFSPAVKNGTIPDVTTTPAKPGETIILWGTGFGPTSPAAPVGVETPSGTTYNTANTVTVTVGGTAATVFSAALAPGFAGLYQVAIQIPASLANGDYPVIATVLGAQSPVTTLITVQQ